MTPLRLLLAFVLLLPAAMLLAAIAAPAVQAVLAPIDIFPLHRVFSRLTMLGVLLGTAWLLWRFHLHSDGTLGYTGHWTRFLQRSALGLLAGIALMTVALVPLFLLDVRTWSPRAPDALIDWGPLALKALGSGLAVALIEETFFRGALQGSLQKLGAWRLAVFAVPVYYAAVHFLGRAASVPQEEVNALSGFTALAGFFSGFAEPLRIADAFVALWFVGLLLALVRRYGGDLAGCIGLHMGFVAIIALFRKVSAPVPDNEWAFLVGNFDGLLGLWIALLTGLCCLVLWQWQRRRTAA